MMSEHQKHTEFLRQCIRYDESATRQELEEGITRVQRDARCVKRAVWLMAILTALVVAGLGYGTVLVANFPYNAPQAIVNLIYALGLGALISLVVFAGLGMGYRWKLDQRREECRQKIAKLLESRLGKPVTTPSQDAGTIASAERI
jgi:type VI protein secretion system component VasF